jgi:mono/diheme cytochrome c family protein
MAARMRGLGIVRPHLDPAEAGDLAGYLFTLSYFDRRADVAAGRRLFTEKRCVACHRLGGAGGTVGPALDGLIPIASPISVAAAMWNHGPRMAELMVREKIARPTFRPSELGDLIAYINSTSPRATRSQVYALPGRADEGGRLFVQKQCVDCHSVGGVGIPRSRASPSALELSPDRTSRGDGTRRRPCSGRDAGQTGSKARCPSCAPRTWPISSRSSTPRGTSSRAATAQRRDPRREQGLPELPRSLQVSGASR